MRSFPSLPLAEPTLLLVNLAAVDAPLLARMLLQPHPQVLIDCQAQPCRQNMGLCYFLSQLLALRHRGAGVWLSNVDPLLHRCLHQLGLAASFSMA